MKIVSNSTPLIYLAELEAFDLLGAIFKTVYIPPAVYREVVRQGKGRPGEQEVKKAPWITRKKLRGKAAVTKLMQSERIDAGEAEAIRLAKESRIRFILLDEYRALRVAETLGLKVIGTPEFLFVAKQRQVLPALKGKLDILLARKLIDPRYVQKDPSPSRRTVAASHH